MQFVKLQMVRWTVSLKENVICDVIKYHLSYLSLDPGCACMQQAEQVL